jgi:hypothetical protein
MGVLVTRMKGYRALYRHARIANDIDALTHLKRIQRRVHNKLTARRLGHMGFWRWLWS